MCIGLHTLPPCLLFCGNYILHESEYDVHIFCVALDIIIYLAPVKSPFPGERGQGDRGSELEVCFKNRLFLQSDRLTLTGKPACFLHSEQVCPFYSTPAMIYSRQYKKKATLSFVFSLFPYFPVTACCFTVGCHCFPKYIR